MVHTIGDIMYLKNLYQRIKLMRGRDLRDIKLFFLIVLVIFVVLSIFNTVKADEGWFKEPAYMFIGFDWEKHQNVCYSKLGHRSEERRVGKECRSRGSPYH